SISPPAAREPSRNSLAAVTFLAAGVAGAAPTPLKATNTWMGSIDDEKLAKEMPENGVITNAKAAAVADQVVAAPNAATPAAPASARDSHRPPGFPRQARLLLLQLEDFFRLASEAAQFFRLHLVFSQGHLVLLQPADRLVVALAGLVVVVQLAVGHGQ